MQLEAALDGLHDERSYAEGRITVQFRFELPTLSLVSNVHAVPFLSDGRCLLVRSREWGWMIPGGTCEPGETPLETAVRELREEAGAVLWSYTPLGADWCHSTADRYRPHLPYPKFCMLFGWGDAEVIGDPEPTEDGETIDEVRPFTVPDAIAAFLSRENPSNAALVHLAAEDRQRVLADRVPA